MLFDLMTVALQYLRIQSLAAAMSRGSRYEDQRRRLVILLHIEYQM